MDNDYEYIEKIVPEKYANLVEGVLTSPDFKWVFSDDSARNESAITIYLRDFAAVENTSDIGQFVNVLYHFLGDEDDPQKPYVNQDIFPMIETIIWFLIDRFPDLPIKSLNRAKANFIYNPNPNTAEDLVQTPHVDWAQPNQCVSLLYYVNDCDGDTILYNETYDDMKKELPLTERVRFTPKKGDAILFKSDIFHVAELPVLKDKRHIINFVIELLDEDFYQDQDEQQEEELREITL